MTKIENLKSILYTKCTEYANQRIENARVAMESAKEAAEEEAKSSAGDKYTTDRAMMQREQEKHAFQLAEAMKLANTMNLLRIDNQIDQVSLGSIVYTSAAIYFIAISLGKLTIGGQDIFVISAVSPVGHQLIGKKRNETIDFNGRKITIKDIG